MKNILKFALIALFGGFLLASCQKEKDNTPKKTEKAITLQQMENPDNPYDKQGKLHNEMLDYVAKTTDISSAKELTSEDMIGVVKKFYDVKKMDFSSRQMKGYEELFSIYAELGYGNGTAMLDSKLCEWFPALCNAGPGPYLPAPDMPLFLLDSDDGGTSTGRTLNFIDSVKVIESKILANKDLSDKQRRAFLCRSSVARFSAGYWHNVLTIQKENSPYYESIQALEGPCVTCDVLGGDAAGAAVGALVGGVGAGPGAAIGSLAVATEKLIRWLW